MVTGKAASSYRGVKIVMELLHAPSERMLGEGHLEWREDFSGQETEGKRMGAIALIAICTVVSLAVAVIDSFLAVLVALSLSLPFKSCYGFPLSRERR